MTCKKKKIFGGGMEGKRDKGEKKGRGRSSNPRFEEVNSWGDLKYKGRKRGGGKGNH